eukprot:553354_1
MAAILCRVCFVEPCKAMAKCCQGCCQCLGECCDCFGQCLASCCQAFDNCCNYITSACDKPFSGCLFTSVVMNLVVLIYSVVAIVSGGEQCNKPLFVLAILLLVCGLINALFSYYMYRTINHDKDNPLFNPQNHDANMSPSAKLYAFFKYDKWMACYIIFVVLLIALLCVSVTMGGTCASDMGQSVFYIAVLLFVYLGIAMLILFSYVALDMFKEWACGPGYWWCWCLPFCWPCLIIGCCLHTAGDGATSSSPDYPGNRTNYVAPPDQHQASPPATVVVVQQPVATQPIVYTQQRPIQTQQVVYTQPQAAVVVQQQPAYNPQAAAPVHPGVFVAHAAPGSNVPQQQQRQVQSEKKEDADYNEIKDKSVKAAKAAGTQAKKAGTAALGWMTKKMVQLNDKAQDNNANNKGGPKEGGEGQKTY